MSLSQIRPEQHPIGEWVLVPLYDEFFGERDNLCLEPGQLNGYPDQKVNGRLVLSDEAQRR
jgi:hypothetical protein